MNIIREISQEFVENQYDYISDVKKFVNEAESESERLRDEKDKKEFFSTLISYVREKHDEHYSTCRNKEECRELKSCNRVMYYLGGLLEKNSIKTANEDGFTNKERVEFDKKLDNILDSLEYLKKGQELTYNDISEEIDELKNLYFLGKKNWKQLLAGKTVEMVTGGMISETVSKELIELTKSNLSNLIQ